jgi:ribose transport system permease protein
MLASFIVVWFILRTTRYGLHLYAIGGGASAAALSGVRVRRVQVTTYVISGVMSSVAGILLASWSQASVPTSTAGNDLLTILAAIILGGVSLTGGAGSPIGTFLGVVFLGVINNALVLWQVSDFYQPVITGIVLILAVSGSAYRQRRRAVTS